MWATIAAAAASLALSIHLAICVLPDSDNPVQSFYDIYKWRLAGTRMAAGALLILASPILLQLCAKVLRVQFRRPGYFLTFLGILLGALAYSLTFLPWPGLLAALFLPPVCALALFAYVLQLPAKQNALLWSVSGCSVAVVLFCGMWGLESLATRTPLNPVRELSAIYQAAKAAPIKPQHVSQVTMEDASAYLMIWPPSGSEWIDHRANTVQFTVATAGNTWDLLIVDRDRKTQARSQGKGGMATSPSFIPDPDFAYFVRVSPTPPPQTQGVVTCFVPLKK